MCIMKMVCIIAKCPRKMRLSFNTSGKKSFYPYWTRKRSLKKRNSMIEKEKGTTTTQIKIKYPDCNSSIWLAIRLWDSTIKLEAEAKHCRHEAWYETMDFRCENNFAFKKRFEEKELFENMKSFRISDFKLR